MPVKQFSLKQKTNIKPEKAAADKLNILPKFSKKDARHHYFHKDYSKN